MSLTVLSKRLFATHGSRRGVVIVAAKRTPIGTFMGGLQNFPATQLGSFAIKGALSAGHVDPNDVEEVILGQVI
jgi:acetyl-CoA C-acetyltransferase